MANEEILPDVTNIKTQETYTLPSKGLIYDETEGIPASITLRRMTTKEDKIRLRNQSEDKIRRDILQACILNPNVDAGKLKLADSNFLLFRLRVLSLLEDTYKLKLTCPYCGTDFVHELALSEVPINYMEESKLELFNMELPLSHNKIQFKLPSLQDMMTMGDRLRNYFEQFPEADKTEVIYTLSAVLYIKTINDKPYMTEELEEFLDSMDIIDNKTFRKRLSELDDLFGLETDLKCLCPKCNKEIEHGLPITAELFNPSL